MPDSSSFDTGGPRPTLAGYSRRALVLGGLWLLFIALTTLGAISTGGPFFESLTAAPSPFGVTSSPALAGPFAMDLWALLSGLFFGLVVVPNRLNWSNGRRFTLGGIAFGIMLGRLTGGGLFGLALAYEPVAPWLALLLAPFALLMGGFFAITILGVISFAVLAFFVGVPMMIFKQITSFENALHIYRHHTHGLTGYMVRFLYWLRNEPLPDTPPDDSRGARFATEQEVAALHAPGAPEAMAFGHHREPLALKTDKHVLIMASTRSGKGVALIIPHLLRYRGSAFVLDPKGENARATGRRRGELNNSVHYLDPFGISGKPQSRFNPLSRFTPENMEAESKALAAALFVAGDREKDHWMAAGQQLVAALILFVYVSEDIPKSEKDLPRVRKILLGNLQPALNSMTQIDAADGLLRNLAASFLETPENEFGSIASTAQRQTEILDNPFLIKCLSAKGAGAEVDFKAWHNGTMTVYLCLSAPKFPVFNRWLRLVLTAALDEMTDQLNPPKLPVCFMLDELATLGHLATVENAVGLAAGYGIQLVTVFQDIAQMRGLYKGRWASFVGNAGVRVLFNLDDFDTAEYWSKFIGGRLVETSSRQEDLYGLSQGQNIGEAMRPLLSPDAIMMNFASRNTPGHVRGDMLVLAQGAHPIATSRVAYWDDRSLDGLWDDPRVGGAGTTQATRSAAATASPVQASGDGGWVIDLPVPLHQTDTHWPRATFMPPT